MSLAGLSAGGEPILVLEFIFESTHQIPQSRGYYYIRGWSNIYIVLLLAYMALPWMTMLHHHRLRSHCLLII